MTLLPQYLQKIGVPPIKCQGIKTKLVPFISRSIEWDQGDHGVWIEPFLGSGVVVFNIAPQRAFLADSNKHIIHFYQQVQAGILTPETVRSYLNDAAPKLAANGADYYYEVRERFNSDGEVLDFLFLNRSCFNGVMRFNRKGKFNVPFGHKPERFSKAYITKIVNQIAWVARQMHKKDWEFHVLDWRATLQRTTSSDFVYLDPPYIGRHTDYYNGWTDVEAQDLSYIAKASLGGVALSMWQENRYRRNDHLDTHWDGFERRLMSHFYHVGSTAELRNEMEEALLITPRYASHEEHNACGSGVTIQQLGLQIST